MNVGPLVRLKDNPTGGLLSLNGPHRRREVPRIVSADAEENRAGRVRRDDNSIAVVIIVVEGRGKVPVHLLHRGRIDASACSPSRLLAIAEDLVRPVAGSPGDSAKAPIIPRPFLYSRRTP